VWWAGHNWATDRRDEIGCISIWSDALSSLSEEHRHVRPPFKGLSPQTYVGLREGSNKNRTKSESPYVERRN